MADSDAEYSASSGETLTKRQQRLAAVANPGADDKEKGRIRFRGGSLEWYDKEEDEWGKYFSPS